MDEWVVCFLPPANEVCEGYVFTGVCLQGGMLGRGGHVWQGGMRGGGACVAGGTCMEEGVCMAGGAWWGGVCGKGECMAGGHAWLWGCAWLGACVAGGHAWLGACMAGGIHGREVGHAWWGACMTCMPPRQTLRLRHTVNERAVRILLECILVVEPFTLRLNRDRDQHLLSPIVLVPVPVLVSVAVLDTV